MLEVFHQNEKLYLQEDLYGYRKNGQQISDNNRLYKKSV